MGVLEKPRAQTGSQRARLRGLLSSLLALAACCPRIDTRYLDGGPLMLGVDAGPDAGGVADSGSPAAGDAGWDAGADGGGYRQGQWFDWQRTRGTPFGFALLGSVVGPKALAVWIGGSIFIAGDMSR